MPRITHFPGRAEFETPYNALFVQDMNEQIPSRHRHWNPDRKVWTVYGQPYITTAVTFTRVLFPTVEIIGDPQPSPSGRQHFTQEDAERAWHERVRRNMGQEQKQEFDPTSVPTFDRWQEGGYGSTRRPVFVWKGNTIYGPWEANPTSGYAPVPKFLYWELSSTTHRRPVFQVGEHRVYGPLEVRPGPYAKPPESPRMNASVEYDRQVLCVGADAPEAVCRAAYKALATIHHPDRGGDTRKMQELNAAWDRLRAKNGWK